MGLGRGGFALVMLTLVGALGAALAAGGPAAGDGGVRGVSAQAVNETLEFVNVEIDRTGMLFADQWVISENSASLDTPQYSHQHTWTIPRTIPPGGAQATVTTVATDKTGGTISAKTTLFGYVNIDTTLTSVEVAANADKGAGRETVTETKTVTLTPRGGGPVTITARVQDGPDVKFNYRIVTPPPPPPPPPAAPPASPPQPALPALTPRSTLPRIGVLTSYAAPRPRGTLALGFPKFPANVTSATVDVVLTGPGGTSVHDPGFIAAVAPSQANAAAALKLCEFMYFAASDEERAISQALVGVPTIRFATCVTVVARILQRAEELRKRREAKPSSRQGRARTRGIGPRSAQARRCKSRTIRARGSRARSPLTVTCTPTAGGFRIKVSSRSRGRSLLSAAGSAPKLIVGRSRRTAAVSGERVNVLWKTSTQR
jgi:hypothetical protein